MKYARAPFKIARRWLTLAAIFAAQVATPPIRVAALPILTFDYRANNPMLPSGSGSLKLF
jgi:hypothetical protein